MFKKLLESNKFVEVSSDADRRKAKREDSGAEGVDENRKLVNRLSESEPFP
jgi:hypothetical protein